MFGKGKATYEVQTCVEGRWRIDAAFEEEDAAVSCARSQIGRPGIEAVKVYRYRSVAGIALQTSVLHLKAPEIKEKPLGVSASGDGAPVCRELADLYGFESRRAIGRILRPFLDRFRITPTELLHSSTYGRKLDDQPGLMSAAINAVARRHADVHGFTVKERTRDLRALVDRAMARARDFLAERRRLPRFEATNLPMTSSAIVHAVGPDDHDFVFRGMLTLELQGASGLTGRLEFLMLLHEGLGEGMAPHIGGLVEGVMADTLGSAEVIRDLLGPQPNLATGVSVLADHMFNRPPAPDGAAVSPLLPRLGRLVATGRAPACRAMLTERIVSALSSDMPLDRREPLKEPALLGVVAEHLKTEDGSLLGGEAMEKVLARRALRHRQALLRRQGMDDVADNLPRHYAARDPG